MITEPRETGERVVRYVLGQCASFQGVPLTLPRALVDSLVDGQMRLVKEVQTASHRRGKVDGWREHWSTDLEDTWISSGAYNANKVIGYESS